MSSDVSLGGLVVPGEVDAALADLLVLRGGVVERDVEEASRGGVLWLRRPWMGMPFWQRFDRFAGWLCRLCECFGLLGPVHRGTCLTK